MAFRPGRNRATFRSRTSTRFGPPPGGPRWWWPLATKWGFIGLLMFIGLAIGFTRETWQALFSSGAPQHRDYVQEGREFRVKVSQLDAAGTAALLIKTLAELPNGDRESYSRANRLAADYTEKRDNENARLNATSSRVTWEEIERRRKEGWPPYSNKMDEELRKSPPNPRELIKALQFGIETGQGIHYHTNRIVDIIERQAARVAEIPVLVREIEQRLKERDSIGTRLVAYAEADALRRNMPSYKFDDPTGDKRRLASERVKATGSIPFPEAVRAFLQNAEALDFADMKAAQQRLMNHQGLRDYFKKPS
jgi:hypothetical protein